MVNNNGNVRYLRFYKERIRVNLRGRKKIKGYKKAAKHSFPKEYQSFNGRKTGKHVSQRDEHDDR